MRSSLPRLLKGSTKIAGLVVHPHPLPTLHRLYNQTLHALDALPPSYVYRTATEAITKQRLSVLEQIMRDHQLGLDDERRDLPGATEAQLELERQLGVAQVELAVDMAEDELALVAKTIEWKA